MNKEQIIAIIRIVVPCIISVLGVLGITQVCDIELESIRVEQVCAVVSPIIGGIMSIYTGWKNNNVTEDAQTAQHYLDNLKAGK